MGSEEAMRLEVTLRIKSLQQIEQKDLIGVRNECIEELTRQLKKLKE